MINFQSIPVSLAGAQFAYLTRGMALIEGLDVYEREVTGDLASEWASQVDALVIAFEAVGENRLAGIV